MHVLFGGPHGPVMCLQAAPRLVTCNTTLLLQGHIGPQQVQLSLGAAWMNDGWRLLVHIELASFLCVISG